MPKVPHATMSKPADPINHSLRVQAQIRRNAEEQHECLKGIAEWEKDVKKKEAELLKKAAEKKVAAVRGQRAAATTAIAAAVPALDGVRESCGVVKTKLTDAPPAAATVRRASASDFELEQGAKDTLAERAGNSDRKVFLGTGVEAQNPASILVPSALPSYSVPVSAPPPRRPAADLEQESRLNGNAFFQAGDYAAAAKCYTRCLGVNPRSGLAFSNRAMAYLKLKDWSKAESDANDALAIDPTHVKSYQRRSAARAALGKLRGALADLKVAERLLLEGGGEGLKSLQVEMRKCKEALRDAVRRAPRRRVEVGVQVGAGRPSADAPLQPETEAETESSAVVLELDEGGGFDVPAATSMPSASPRTLPARTPVMPPAPPSPASRSERPAASASSSKAPTSAYEFERQWRCCKSLADKASFLYLTVHPAKSSPSCLGSLLSAGFQDADMFEDVLKALESEEGAEGRVASLAEHVEDLARVKNVNLMCFMAEKGLVQRVVDKAFVGKKVPAHVKKNFCL